MIYCIDIDETLCHNFGDDYAHSMPCKEAIDKVNKLYQEGHIIKLFTGRGSFDGTDWEPFLQRQLKQWGVSYHELLTNKPHADVFIDDKALNTHDWLKDDYSVKKVPRPWGKELWIVNCDEYCCKLLYIPKGSCSELHFHYRKKETFWCLKGVIRLQINGKEVLLDIFSSPVTIFPGEKHSFSGLSHSILVEISTHHREDDVKFLSEATRHDGSCISQS